MPSSDLYYKSIDSLFKSVIVVLLIYLFNNKSRDMHISYIAKKINSTTSYLLALKNSMVKEGLVSEYYTKGNKRSKKIRLTINGNSAALKLVELKCVLEHNHKKEGLC